MNEPLYFLDVYALTMPRGLKYCVMCSQDGKVEATWTVNYNPFSRKGSDRLAFLLSLLDFIEGRERKG